MRKWLAHGTLLLIAAMAITPGSLEAGSAKVAQDEGSTVVGAKDEHVIMISIDGLVPAYYLSPGRIGLRVPNLLKLKLDGAYAEGVESVYPSVTYPAHTTLITGVKPVTHGIVHNQIFEPPTEPQTRAWYWFAESLKADTLWMLAKRAGLSTAGIGWPVTAGADLDYNFPEIWDPFERPITAKRTIEYATPGLVLKALGAGVGKELTTDGRRTAVAEFIIKEYKPNLVLVHLVELDSAHHDYGVRSPQALEVAEQTDIRLGRIIQAAREAGIIEKTTFFIVSDHGFAEVREKFEPGVVLVREKLITLGEDGKPVDWKAAAWSAGGSCAIVLRDPNDSETAAKVAEVFNRIASRSRGPLNRVVDRKTLDRLGAVPSALLMLEAATGFTIGEAMTGPEIYEAKNYRGTHGQLPTRAEMRASLIISGRGARAGAKVTIARMIDIAPTAAALLNLSFEKAEGVVIREMMTSSARKTRQR